MFQHLFRWLRYIVNPETIAACGHDTFLRGVVTVQGVRLTLRLPRNSFGYQDYCLDCEAKRAVLCVQCRRLIVAGDLVAVRQSSERVIVCCAFCADSPSDRLVPWSPDHLPSKERIPTKI